MSDDRTKSLKLYMFEMIRRLERRRGRPILREALAKDLDMRDRTLRRAVNDYNEFVDAVPAGLRINFPRIETFCGGDRRARIQLSAPTDLAITDVYRYAAAHLAARHLGAVDSQILTSQAEHALGELPAARHHDWIGRIERGFYYRPLAPKRYPEKTLDILEDSVFAILYRRPVSMVYQAASSDSTSSYRFAPYTLIAHRDGLYLAGIIDDYDDVTLLAIERIQSLELDRRATFQVPDEFDPDRLFDGSFGVWRGGEPETIELAFTAGAARGARDRHWPGLIGWKRMDDGRELLQLELPVTPDFVAWIRSWGQAIEVVRPAELRNQVATELAAALAQYD